MSNTIFGKKFAKRYYSWNDLRDDSFIPGIIALVILIIQLFTKEDICSELLNVINIGLNIIPAMLSILLAAYAILMSMYWSPLSNIMKKTKSGNRLLNELNTSFLIAILIICSGVLFLLIEKIIGIVEVDWDIELIEIINSILYAISLYLILFSIFILKDIAFNIYNFASFTINTEIKDEVKKKENEISQNNKKIE